ncbi:hypothetical protein LCGC14_2068510 [marine sediment metagenome]|uniref:Uncharacterized protein n=1 Tax=marine sediment metagenome TaxID=412755 RepID=A0A0F9GXI0_9ZZZZ
MAAKKGKKTTRRKARKKPAVDKYRPDALEFLRMLVIDCGQYNKKHVIAWKKIAKAFTVSVMTLHRWRDPREKTYKPEFAKLATELQEEVTLGNVKRNIIDAAGHHWKRMVVKEMKTRRPEGPDSKYAKPELIKYARRVLGLRLKKSQTISEIREKINAAILSQTTTKLEVVRQEETECFGEPTARTLVVANLGPVEERWVDKKEHLFTEEPVSDEECKKTREYMRRQMV